MNRQPTAPNDMTIEQRMRTVRTLWIALVISIGMYFLVTRFAGRPENVEPNNQLSLALLVAGFSASLISFVIKNKLVSRAIERQQVQQVQQGYVVGWAIAEVGALLGILDFFTTSDPYYYVLLILGVSTQLFHFPRREHFENAMVNKPIEW